MLDHYRPGTKQLVVVIYPETDPTLFLERHRDTADFVILTNAAAGTDAGGGGAPVRGPHEYSQGQREKARIDRFKE